MGRSSRVRTDTRRGCAGFEVLGYLTLVLCLAAALAAAAGLLHASPAGPAVAAFCGAAVVMIAIVTAADPDAAARRALGPGAIGGIAPAWGCG